jgi:hypothetical protein
VILKFRRRKKMILILVIRRNQKIQEIGLIAQEKLNDKEFNTVIDVEFKIQAIQIICVVVFQLPVHIRVEYNEKICIANKIEKK